VQYTQVRWERNTWPRTERHRNVVFYATATPGKITLTTQQHGPLLVNAQQHTAFFVFELTTTSFLTAQQRLKN
jgi:hypothetical protein